MIRTYSQNYFLYHQSQSSTFKVQLELIRCPGLGSLDFLSSPYEKNFWTMGEVQWAVDAIAWNFLMELGSTYSSMGGFRDIFKVMWFK